MMRNKLFLPMIALALVTFSVQAQEKDRNSEYREFVNNRNKEFSDWRKKANDEYSDYLTQTWNEFLVFSGKKDPVGVVPDKPTFYSGDEKSAKKQHGLPASEDMWNPAVTPDDVFSASYNPALPAVNIDFFGLVKEIPFDAAMKLPYIAANEHEVSEGWKSISNSDYIPTLDALSAIQTEWSLNDWATYMVIKKFSEAIYPEDRINERILTQMFFLCQLKYKARVGAAGSELILLLPFSESVYQVKYVTDGDDEFYIFGYSRLSNDTPLYSFNKDFAISESKFSLAVPTPMKVSSDYYITQSLPKWSSIIGDDVEVKICKPFVSFVLDYPQASLVTYHKSALDKETGKGLFKAVRYKILKEGMTQQQAVSFILNLIQNGFDYKTDYEMFGRAKPLFIDESLYYGSNNCKDRVLIFSWLIKNTMNLNTVLLGYEGHVACGVEFTEAVDGDSFIYDGHTYVMCDPTYINAPIGATMPQFRGVKPTMTLL